MPYTIPFTDDELRRIETAERAGFDVSAFFRAKVHELPTIAPTDTLTRPSPPVSRLRKKSLAFRHR